MAERFTIRNGVVRGATITSIAGGKSARYTTAERTPEARQKSVMKSETSRVGKSRFAEATRKKSRLTLRGFTIFG